jgi:dTDP-4-amino-4,6-dideoxygalactose transaminase
MSSGKVTAMGIAFSPPDIGEDEVHAVSEVLCSGWITTGPVTKQFESEIAAYVGTPRAVCLSSATAAMELILRLFGIGEGDEVITSAYTYTASASVIHHVGAKVVLCDVKPGTYEIDHADLESRIGPRTKAIIPVDLGGVMCDYDQLLDLVSSRSSDFRPQGTMQEALGRVLVLGDAAHSFGSVRRGVRSGAAADFTAFSFHAVKNLTTGEGGAATWRPLRGVKDEDIYRQFMLLSLHGQTRDALSKTEARSWDYDVVEPYYKFNMTDIMAAIGRTQLVRYDGLLARRRELVAVYKDCLAEVPVESIAHEGPGFTSNCHLMLTRVVGFNATLRNQLITRMAERGISCNVHFKPLPLLAAYRRLGLDIHDYPHAWRQFENEVTLPLHTLLSAEDVRSIVCAYSREINVLSR